MSHEADFPPQPDRSKLATVSTGSRKFLFHPEVAPIFDAFNDEVVARGYSIDRGDQLDDWSWAYRPIRGTTNQWSNHARGCAEDLNAVTNPMGPRLITDMPDWVPMLARHYGLNWGGWYGSRKDAMHYEWTTTIAEARALIASWKKGAHPPAEVRYIDATSPASQVHFLQVLLAILGKYPEEKIDGKFGTLTGQAVRNFKRDHNKLGGKPHLSESEDRGWMVGPSTLKAIGEWVNLVAGAK